MGICSPSKPYFKLGVLLLLVWLGTLLYMWFPNLLLSFSSRSRGRQDDDAEYAHLHSNSSSSSGSLGHQTVGDTVHICITTSEDTLGGSVALINSIVSNTHSPVKFHLVTTAEAADHLSLWIQKTQLKSIKYELKIFPEDWVVDKVKIRGGRQELASPMNYARYYLPKLFPKLRKKIIFIDDDCIVQGDIGELYRVKIPPKYMAAFSEDCVGMAKRLTFMKNNYADYIDFKNKHVQEMKIDPNACAFNTGVFVTDLADWQKHNITGQLEYWLQLNTREEVYGNERGGGGSQPPMMLVFYHKYIALDPNWHVRFLGWTPGTSYTKMSLQHAKLLHWNGRFKPWGRAAQHSDLWEKYFIPDPAGEFHLVRRAKDLAKKKEKA